MKADETNRLQVFENKTNAEFFINLGNLSSEYLTATYIERQVFELINTKRREYGLKPLIWNEQSASVARMHSANMAQYRFFSHQGLDGKKVDNRADSIGLKKWRMIGENIASLRGYNQPFKQVINCWMNSPGHRENILREKWRESGVGIAVARDGTYYFTQVFLKK
ncbi:MAG: CAP domain-containing protein [Pyrinomonadaceae bacterium]|nr:CAP domain-containing protein [Pyrinomonadaceae bacterium]